VNEREAKSRRAELVPQLKAYGRIDRVFWPILTATAEADFTSPVVTTDHRGHRITRLGTESTRSDAAPDGAAFLLGGSYAFGVGASEDSGTLAAALWRRTGVPWVNLGIRAATSAQELVAALPFVDRRTTFVVCSGLNNFATARGAPGLDPLFGPMHHQAHLGMLASVSITRLARLVNDPLALFGDRRLRKELKRRRDARIRGRLRPVNQAVKRVRGRFAQAAPALPKASPPTQEDAEGMVAAAAARQLRDLRLLRRIVADGARVVFALQPLSPHTGKRLSPEEEELFALLEMLQPNAWPRLKRQLETEWGPYAAMLEQGCADAGVPFVDLSRADYHGWCFVDRVHMTDHGHDLAASVLEEVVR
jgi:hypothetical protein